MRRVLTGLIVIVSLVPSIVFAHETKENNGSIVFLHVNPNDDPVAKERAAMRFLITRRDKTFPSNDCDCKVTIMDKGVNIFSQPVFTGGQISTGVPYIFPHAGIFQAVVTGTPTKSTAFQAFSISFDIRVEDDGLLSNFYSQYIEYGAGILFLLIGLTGMYTFKIKNKDTTP
jgi:hypothetical protein